MSLMLLFPILSHLHSYEGIECKPHTKGECAVCETTATVTAVAAIATIATIAIVTAVTAVTAAAYVRTDVA